MFDTVADNFNQGATFGVGNRAAAGLAALVQSGIDGKPISENYKRAREVGSARLQAEMEQNPATAITANLVGGVGTGGLAAGTKAGTAVTNSLRSGNLAARVGKGITAGAASGGLYGAGSAEYGNTLEGATEGAILGGVAGGAIPAVGAAVGQAKKALTPIADEGLREVGKLAQKYNIPLSLDQITNSRALKTIQKAGQDLPFSGQQSFRDGQMKAFNKALFKTVGVDADAFTTKNMENAFDKVGGEFDSLTKGQNFNIGGTFIDDLATTADDVASAYGKEAAEIFQKEASSVISDFSKGDVISGELISRQRSRINALARKATDPNIKGALLDLENNIVDGITGGNPALQDALSAAKQRYKNLIVLEPIANKAKGGMISPSLLNNRVSQVYKRAHTVGKSGEIGDLARIGHELLPELGGSDTAQKMFYMGAALPTGYIAPATTATTLGANRAFQSGINRNQSIVGGALNRVIPKSNSAISPVLSVPAGAAAGAIGVESQAPRMMQPAIQQPVIQQPRSEAPQNDVMESIKAAESGGDPNAQNPNSSASGLYQFTDQTWKDSVSKWGGELGITEDMKNDPQAQEVMVRKLAGDNARILTRQLDREPDVADMYVAHFLGANDAVKLIKSQGSRKIAANLFPKAAAANKTIFFEKNGRPRTVDEVYQVLASKVA
jgi:hypothetical protein